MNTLPPPDPERCVSVRRDGERCGGARLDDVDVCWAHDPRLAEKRAEASRRGGRNSSKLIRLQKAMPPRLVPVFERLERAFEDVLAGRITARQATAAAAVARAMIATATAGELEQRVRDIEAARAGDKDAKGAS